MLVRTIDMAYSNTGIGTLLLDSEADQWDPPKPANKQDRLQRLFKAMRDDGSDDAATAALEIARHLLSKGAFHTVRWWDEAVETLAADGWEYDADADQLVSTVPGVQVAEETSKVEEDLTARAWTDAAGHYRQALDAFSRGQWASANAQLRSTLEELVRRAAELVTGKPPREARGAIDALRTSKSLEDGEYDILRGLWAMSQHGGSHPGLSGEEEARFRLMAITSECRYLLSRLPS